MIVLKRVLVATDFGPASEAALTYGRALARSFGATLHVLHVAENLFLRPTAADPHALMAAMARRLERAAHRRGPQRLHARAVLEISDQPADEIARLREAGRDRSHRDGRRMAATAWRTCWSAASPSASSAPRRVPVLTVRHPEHEFVLPDAAGPQQEARRP